MTTWQTKKLGELLQNRDSERIGKTVKIKKNDYQDSGRYPVVDQGVNLISGYIDDESKLYKGKLPVVIFGDHTRIFKFIDFKFAIGADGTKILQPNKELLVPKYFYYALLNLRIENLGYKRHFSVLRRKNIDLLPLKIQHQIVSRLDAIRKAQELNDKRIALADELFQSLLNKELALKSTDRKINKLEEVAEIIMGQSPPSSTYNTKRNGLPFLQGKFEFGEIYPIPIKFCSQPLRIAKKNDVLLSVRAPVGPVNLAPSECCIGRGLSAIRAKAEKLDQLFLFYFMKLNEERMSLLGCGSTFNAIGRDHIEKIKISLPPLQTQRQIVEKLQAVQDYKKKLSEQKQKLKQLFDSCLDKAMKGDLVN